MEEEDEEDEEPSCGSWPNALSKQTNRPANDIDDFLTTPAGWSVWTLLWPIAMQRSRAQAQAQSWSQAEAATRDLAKTLAESEEQASAGERSAASRPGGLS
ncbi:GM15977 [Drosophila sechellia]|uniref:GM15977 n=1 Tax=Drosophila sechellia TaxID=7238 RepID=B4I8F2_DROSE|nr:GM15977 [Drosophila sechellia]